MEATLLTVNETFYDEKLDIIKKMGTKAKATDFAIVTGVWINNEGYAPYYLKTPYKGYARAVNNNGNKNLSNTNGRNVGVRPALKFSSISEIYEYSGEILEDNKLKLGMYADNALQKNDQIEWENKLTKGTLRNVGSYLLDLTKYDDYDVPCTLENVPIYEYDGKKAIRMKVNSSFNGESFKLSNGQRYKDGDYVWLEVKDMIWNFDISNLTAVLENVILGGIRFNDKNDYQREEDFPNTNMGKYLNDVFLPNLLQFSKSKFSNLNNCNLIEKIRKQQEYIEFLEKQLIEYKNFINELNIGINEFTSSIASSDVLYLINNNKM